MNDQPPRSSSNQLILEKNATQLIVATYDSGALIIHGWTVSLSVEDVRLWVETFGRNSTLEVEEGFMFSDGRFVISHRGCKLTVTAEEGTAIVRFLADRYDLD